jgi:hypothetical protein
VEKEMNEHSEVLSLAEWLATSPNTRDQRAATALRCLHEVEKDRDDWKESTILANQRFKLAEEKLAGLHEVNQELVEALEQLARLGSGDQYGNSEGNLIARAALAKAKGEV